jgi:hypothetical protein
MQCDAVSSSVASSGVFATVGCNSRMHASLGTFPRGKRRKARKNMQTSRRDDEPELRELVVVRTGRIPRPWFIAKLTLSDSISSEIL